MFVSTCSEITDPEPEPEPEDPPPPELLQALVPATAIRPTAAMAVNLDLNRIGLCSFDERE
jgi:hypothetical protein